MNEHDKSPTCLHEEQIQGISRKIAELDARADYKDKRIDEINENMKELQQSISSLDKTINDFIIQSLTGDNSLKDYINTLENRITALESAKSEQWKLFTGVGVVIGVITFIVQHIIFH